MTGLEQLIEWQGKAERAFARGAYETAHGYCMQLLKIDPGYGEAYFLLAQIAAEYDNYGKAAEVFDRAIACNPDNPKYHAWRAKCLVRLNRQEEAHSAASHARSLQPADALTLDTIGVVFSRTGYHEDAIALFRQAVRLEPGNANMHYNLAAAEQFAGDFAAAEDSYRTAIALAPDFYRAHSALSQLRPQTPADNHISSLGALFARISANSPVDPDAALHIGHALAKEHEDLGEFPAALDWLEKGNAAKARAAAWDPEQAQVVFEAARRAVPGMDDNGSPSEEPIFVVGMPRTGTTLVDRIVSSHPEVFSAGELGNFALVLKRQTGTPSNLVLDAATLMAGAQLNPERLGAAYLASTRPRTGHTRRFVDKMPLNFFYCGLIHGALPNARIICLRRHPLDTCLSNFRQLFATSFSYYNYAYSLESIARYYAMFDRLIGHWRAHLPPDRFIEVHYEALVADQESQSRRLIEHCGLEWDERCLEFHRNAAPVATASSVQVRRPMYASSVGRYKRYGRRLESLAQILESLGVDVTGSAQT